MLNLHEAFFTKTSNKITDKTQIQKCCPNFSYHAKKHPLSFHCFPVFHPQREKPLTNCQLAGEKVPFQAHKISRTRN